MTTQRLYLSPPHTSGHIPLQRADARPVAAVEIWPVALVLAASVVSTAALPIALAVAALFWPIRWLAYGQLTLRTAADWPAGLLCSQAALLVHGLLDAALWGARPAVLLWAVWGLTMAAWNQAATSARVRI